MTVELIGLRTARLFGEPLEDSILQASRELEGCGFTLAERCTCELTLLHAAVAAATARGNAVLLLGGASMDGAVKQAVCDWLELPSVLHEPTLARVRAAYQKAGRQPSPQAEALAEFPEGATVFPGVKTVLPGYALLVGGVPLLLLPGDPEEFVPILRRSALPYLQKSFQKDTPDAKECTPDAAAAIRETVAQPAPRKSSQRSTAILCRAALLVGLLLAILSALYFIYPYAAPALAKLTDASFFGEPSASANPEAALLAAEALADAQALSAQLRTVREETAQALLDAQHTADAGKALTASNRAADLQIEAETLYATARKIRDDAEALYKESASDETQAAYEAAQQAMKDARLCRDEAVESAGDAWTAALGTERIALLLSDAAAGQAVADQAAAKAAADAAALKAAAEAAALKAAADAAAAEAASKAAEEEAASKAAVASRIAEIQKANQEAALEEESSSEEEAPRPSGDGGKLTIYAGGKKVSGKAAGIVAQIVMNEMGSSFQVEALKAQAVAAYTFIRQQNASGLTPSFGLKTPSAAVQRAVDAVIGEAVYYKGNLAFTPFYATSAGVTVSSKEVWGGSYPYLVSVESEIDEQARNFEVDVSMSADDLADRVDRAMGIDLWAFSDDPEDWLEIKDYTDGGRYVKSIRVGKKTVTGRYLRENVLGLRSAAFDWRYRSDKFTFTTYGYGHGVGMSQTGADLYASEEGWNYVDILTHFYPGTKVQ